MTFYWNGLFARLAFGAVSWAVLSGCSSDSNKASGSGARYVLGSVVIGVDDNRTTYVQTVADLKGPFNNETAIEMAGNGVVMAGGKNFFVGLVEEPTWVRYGIDGNGKLAETGRMSLANLGAAQIDYGNVYIDATTAVSVFTSPAVAVVWDPSTMQVTTEIPLSFLEKDGYDVEVWTTAAHDGLVYIPGRWANWEEGLIFQGVSMTVLDPKQMKVLFTATDDRCASGGRMVFDEAGYGYIMGDGRNYSSKMFANGRGETAPDNCLLRLAPGATEFDANYYYAIPALTGGPESIDELQNAQDGKFAITKMFYPDKLEGDGKPVDFDFWSLPVHKLWRITLADPPSAEPVNGVPFSAIGFSGSALGKYLYTGESQDGATSQVFETNLETNQASERFSMDGYFNGLYELAR